MAGVATERLKYELLKSRGGIKNISPFKFKPGDKGYYIQVNGKFYTGNKRIYK